MTKGKRLIALMMSVMLTVSWCSPIASGATVQATDVVQPEVLYEDDFTTDAKYKEALGDTSWQSYKRPTWEDGKLISGDYTAAKDAKFVLLNGLDAGSLMNYTVEADITADTAGDRQCYVAVYGRTTGDNQAGDSYRFCYQGKSGKFLLVRNATSASGNKANLVENVKIADYFSDYTKGYTIRISITAITYQDHVNVICEASYKGETKEIINYTDTSAGRYTCGMPGFGLQQQNSSLDNVTVLKVVVDTDDDIPTEIEPGTVIYEDDFANDTKYKEALGSTS